MTPADYGLSTFSPDNEAEQLLYLIAYYKNQSAGSGPGETPSPSDYGISEPSPNLSEKTLLYLIAYYLKL